MPENLVCRRRSRRPDLITVKGRKLLEQAGAILLRRFAGRSGGDAATRRRAAKSATPKDMTLEEMTLAARQAAATRRSSACRPATPASTAR